MGLPFLPLWPVLLLRPSPNLGAIADTVAITVATEAMAITEARGLQRPNPRLKPRLNPGVMADTTVVDITVTVALTDTDTVTSERGPLMPNPRPKPLLSPNPKLMPRLTPGMDTTDTDT